MKHLILLIATTVCCYSQTAQITGLVTDASDAVVPAARVSVTNVDTGIVRRSETGGEGSYTIPLLPPGQYRLEVAAGGFRPSIRDGVVLTVNQVARQDFQLEVGAAAEAITVTAQELTLETATSSVGQIVNNQQVSGLPMNRRQALSLMTLLPNVLPNPSYDPTNWGRSTMVSINGTRDRSMEILLDGTPALAVGPGGASALPGYQPSLDTVREFRVVTNSLAAEFGNSSA